MTTYLNNQQSANFNNPSIIKQLTPQRYNLYPNNNQQTQYYEGVVPTKRLGPVSDPPLKETCCNSCCWIVAAIVGLIGLTFAILFGLGALGGNKSTNASNSNLTNQNTGINFPVSNNNNQGSTIIGASNQNNNGVVNGQTNVSPIISNTNVASNNPSFVQPAASISSTQTTSISLPNSIPNTQSAINYQGIQPTFQSTIQPTIQSAIQPTFQPITQNFQPTIQNTQPMTQPLTTSSNSMSIQPVPYTINPVPFSTNVQPLVGSPVQQITPISANPVSQAQVNPNYSYVQPIPY